MWWSLVIDMDTNLFCIPTDADNHFNIAVISNIAFEPYFQNYINKAFSGKNGFVSVSPIDLSEFLCNDEIDAIHHADLIVVIPNLEAMYQDFIAHHSNNNSREEPIEGAIIYFENIYSKIRLKTLAPIIWFGFEDYYTNLYYTTVCTLYLDGFADKINTLFSVADDAVFSFIDTKRLIAKIGIDSAYDLKNKYRWNSPYSKRMIECICAEISKQYAIYVGKTKKCLVLDCDNVLWGGIVSEDGIENIHLSGSGFGRMYRDFQLFVLELYRRGVILAICSKNDLKDVISIFHEHSEMVLKEENIACFAVNWNDKPGNIREISKSLNIGLDSIVFVDDSTEEIAAVKALLPEVTSIRFHRDMDYNQFSCFNLKNQFDISDVEKRNETYRTNKQREDLKIQYKCNEDYIKALRIKTEIHKVIPMEYSRVSELTQRTNKCTNGIRFTVWDIKESLKDERFELFSVYISDRFADLGLVGAFAIKDATLVLFSLSCRALGRSIESTMIEYIVSKWDIKKVKFYSTGKNDNIKNILEDTFPFAIIE